MRNFKILNGKVLCKVNLAGDDIVLKKLKAVAIDREDGRKCLYDYKSKA